MQPARAKPRQTFPTWLIVFLVVTGSACLFACAAVPLGFNYVFTDQRRTYQEALDDITLPREITYVDEEVTGTPLCLDECVRVQRVYVSTLPPEQTYNALAAELRRLGYRCSQVCDWHGLGTAASHWSGHGRSVILDVDVVDARIAIPAGYISRPLPSPTP